MIRQTAAAVTVFLLALMAGMFFAGIGTDGSAVSTTLTTESTTTIAPDAVFFDEGETIVGPVAIVAAEPFLDGTQLVLPFEIASLAPTADSAEVVQQMDFGSSLVVSPQELITIFPREWILTTSVGEVPGGAANPNARSARFEVGDGFALSSIDKVTMPSYALLAPVSSTLELTGGESAPVAPGISARLVAVTEQANTIVQVELMSDSAASLEGLRVTGSGPGWLAAVREAEGRPRWNLTYDGTNAPEPIRLLVEGSAWVDVEGTIEVVLPEAS
jgi:hypothetical protein